MARTRWLLLIAAAGGIAWWAAHSGGEAPRAPGKGAQAVPVRLATAAARDVELRLDLPGRTEASASVTVRSRIDGQVQTTAIREGQRVAAGELLVQLDPADLKAKLAQAQANNARSQAEAARARANLARYRDLRAKGFVAEEKIAELAAAAAAAQASEQADAAAADLARLQVEHASVRAPFAGVLGATQVFPGSTVKANETVMVSINRVTPLKVAFTVPEKYLSAIRERLAKPGALYAASVLIDGVARPAKVDFIDNAVNAASGTVLMKASLDNPDGQLAAGQFVTLRLPLNVLRQVVVVPANAVQQGSDGSYVYAVRGGKAERISVDVAAVQDDVAVLAKGPAAGDRVVIEGQLRLVDGAAVRDADAPPNPAPESTPAAAH